jgi:phosphate transport system permease protein
VEASAEPLSAPLHSRRRLTDRLGDIGLHVVTGMAALAAIALAVLLTYQLVSDAWPSIDEFGLSFVWHSAWDPVTGKFGALDFIYGTAVTSFAAMLLAAPLAIAIGLYLAELAPKGVRGIAGSLVEMLAAVPSVVLGLWGILVLGPWVRDYIEPWLGSWFGFLPIFQGSHNQAGMLPAIIVLTIMIIPITASICRELFLSVPGDIKEGAYGLGLTRWEMVRGVTLPYTRGGVVAAVLLGTGRAIGEALAVTQVIGGFAGMPTVSTLHVSSIVYLALILLVFALLTNVAATWIIHKFEFDRGAAA